MLRALSLLKAAEIALLLCCSLRIALELFREITNDVRLFGGKFVLLSGDFSQVTNVVHR